MQTRHNHKGYIGVSADCSEDPAFAVNTLPSGRSIRFAWQLAVVKKKSLLAAGRLFPQQKSGWRKCQLDPEAGKKAEEQE